MKDIEQCAAALYDGGWCSHDTAALMLEYDLTNIQANKICELLKTYESEDLKNERE